MSNGNKFKVGDIVTSNINGNYHLKGKRHTVTLVPNDTEVVVGKQPKYMAEPSTWFTLYKRYTDSHIRCVRCEQVKDLNFSGSSSCDDCLSFS